MTSRSSSHFDASKKVSQAREAIAANQIEQARHLLVEAIDLDSQSEAIWWLLATIIDDPEDLQICLENVLRRNPHHQAAWQRLKAFNLSLYMQQRIVHRGLVDLSPFHRLSWREREDREKDIQAEYVLILEEDHIQLDKDEQAVLLQSVRNDLIGLGVLEGLLKDDTVTALYVRSPSSILIEVRGQWKTADIAFANQLVFDRVVEKLMALAGDHGETPPPVIETRLADGSRVSIVMSSIASDSQLMIGKFSKKPLQITDLIRFGTLTPEVGEFLRACIIAQLKILVIGDEGSGKFTLLNVLSGFIPNDERIITVERIAALQITQEHCVSLESRTSIPVDTVLAHRPDRVIFGDLRRDQLFDFIDTGLCLPVYGVLAARDITAALRQIEMGLLMTIPGNTSQMVRALISRAIDVIVAIQRLPDGSRKVIEVRELKDSYDGQYQMQTLFEVEQTGFEDGKILGHTRPMAATSFFAEQIAKSDINLPANRFQG